jgi:hypothetical protein
MVATGASLNELRRGHVYFLACFQETQARARNLPRRLPTHLRKLRKFLRFHAR